MNKVVKSLAFILLLLGNVFAVKINNSIYGGKYTYTIGDNIQVVSVIEGDFSQSEITGFKVQNSEKYKYLGVMSNNASRQVTFESINGSYHKVKKTVIQIIFVVTPNQNGKVTIKSPSVLYKGKRIEGNNVFVNVVDKKEAMKKISSKGYKSVNPDFWFRFVPSKTKCGVGEEIGLDIDFGSRAGLQIGNINLPDIEKIKKELSKGFIVKQLFATSKDIQNTLRNKEINGKIYKIYSLHYALYPIRADKYFIGPFSIKYSKLVQDRRGGNDPFFNMIFNNAKQIEAEANSNMIEFDVKDNGYSTGLYRLKHNLSSKDIKTGEPLNITFKIIGKGNIKSLNLPQWNVGDEFSSYPPEVNYKFKKNRNNGFTSIATVKYLIIPKFKGDFVLPKYKVLFFNARKKIVDTLISNPIKIQVKQGKNRGTISVASGDTNSTVTLGEDNRNQAVVGKKYINYIITDKLSRVNFIYKNYKFQLILILLVLLNFIAAFRRKILNLFLNGLRKDLSVKLISQIKKGKNWDDFSLKLRDYISVKSKGFLKGKSFDEIISIASNNNFDELKQLARFGQLIEIVKYADDETVLWGEISKKELIKNIKASRSVGKWQELLRSV